MLELVLGVLVGLVILMVGVGALLALLFGLAAGAMVVVRFLTAPLRQRKHHR